MSSVVFFQKMMLPKIILQSWNKKTGGASPSIFAKSAAVPCFFGYTFSSTEAILNHKTIPFDKTIRFQDVQQVAATAFAFAAILKNGQVPQKNVVMSVVSF